MECLHNRVSNRDFPDSENPDLTTIIIITNRTRSTQNKKISNKKYKKSTSAYTRMRQYQTLDC